MTTFSQIEMIPEYLIYEQDDGSPIYYRGYQEVLSGKKQLEEIMGESVLQSWLKIQIGMLLSTALERRFIITVGELGLRVGPKSFRAVDIAIFRQGAVALVSEYAEVPPEAVIEIDTKADLKGWDRPIDYFHQKTEQLLDFGVGKVIWIFTKSQKVMVCEKNADWIVSDWHKDILIIENVILNTGQLIARFSS